MRPGPAYGLVLLGDPPSFDEDDSDPHCCVKPLDAVALPSLAATAACRSRHGPPASCSAPMVSRLRYLLTVRPGMPPRPPPLPRTPRQCRLRCRTSAVSPRAPRTFQKSREAAACRMRCPPRPRSGAWGIGFDSPPPPVDRAVWRIRAHAGASPAAAPPYSRIAQAAIRHLGVAIHELWLPRPHRISTGCLVSPVCRDGSRPRCHRAAPTWPLQ